MQARCVNEINVSHQNVWMTQTVRAEACALELCVIRPLIPVLLKSPMMERLVMMEMFVLLATRAIVREYAYERQKIVMTTILVPSIHVEI